MSPTPWQAASNERQKPHDRPGRLPIFAAARVPHPWLIDPGLRRLEAFENLEGRWLLLGAPENDHAIQLPPFYAISFPLNALWAD